MPSGSSDLRLLLIWVVSLHSLEMFAKEFVVVKITFHKFTLILFGLLLALFEVGSANDEISQHYVRRFSTMVFTVQISKALDGRQTHLPRSVCKHNYMGPEFRSWNNGFLTRSNSVYSAVKRMLRPGPYFGSRLFVVKPVTFNESGLKGIHDHRSSLVEPHSWFVHVQAKRFKFPSS